MELDKQGVRAVAVVSTEFENLARSIMKSRGRPEFPLFVVPSNVEALSEEELRTLAEGHFPHIAEKLAGPGKPQYA